MIKELEHHGYNMSAGTLYPVLHTMEKEGLLLREDKLIDGKIRKYYTTTSLGTGVLNEARKKAYELFREVKD